MKDRITQFPHRYQMVPVAGQPDTYDIIAKPGTITEVGTPINKATLLSDATAALYGLEGATATPNDVLSILRGMLEVKTVKGAYTGNGAGNRNITLAFDPYIVIITFDSQPRNTGICIKTLDASYILHAERDYTHGFWYRTYLCGPKKFTVSTSEVGYVTSSNTQDVIYNYFALGV